MSEIGMDYLETVLDAALMSEKPAVRANAWRGFAAAASDNPIWGGKLARALLRSDRSGKLLETEEKTALRVAATELPRPAANSLVSVLTKEASGKLPAGRSLLVLERLRRRFPDLRRDIAKLARRFDASLTLGRRLEPFWSALGLLLFLLVAIVLGLFGPAYQFDGVWVEAGGDLLARTLCVGLLALVCVTLIEKSTPLASVLQRTWYVVRASTGSALVVSMLLLVWRVASESGIDGILAVDTWKDRQRSVWFGGYFFVTVTALLAMRVTIERASRRSERQATRVDHAWLIGTAAAVAATFVAAQLARFAGSDARVLSDSAVTAFFCITPSLLALSYMTTTVLRPTIDAISPSADRTEENDRGSRRTTLPTLVGAVVLTSVVIGCGLVLSWRLGPYVALDLEPVRISGNSEQRVMHLGQQIRIEVAEAGWLTASATPMAGHGVSLALRDVRPNTLTLARELSLQQTTIFRYQNLLFRTADTIARATDQSAARFRNRWMDDDDDHGPSSPQPEIVKPVERGSYMLCVGADLASCPVAQTLDADSIIAAVADAIQTLKVPSVESVLSVDFRALRGDKQSTVLTMSESKERKFVLTLATANDKDSRSVQKLLHAFTLDRHDVAGNLKTESLPPDVKTAEIRVYDAHATQLAEALEDMLERELGRPVPIKPVLAQQQETGGFVKIMLPAAGPDQSPPPRPDAHKLIFVLSRVDDIPKIKAIVLKMLPNLVTPPNFEVLDIPPKKLKLGTIYFSKPEEAYATNLAAQLSQPVGVTLTPELITASLSEDESSTINVWLPVLP